MTTTMTHATVKDAAKAMKLELHAAFPGTQFSVRKGTGTGSAWIDVRWIDGPTDDMVRHITDPYICSGTVQLVEGVERTRQISMPVLLQAQDLIRSVMPGFEVYDAEGRWLLSARPDRVEVFHLGGWRFGGGSASNALREVADLLILNPRPGPGA